MDTQLAFIDRVVALLSKGSLVTLGTLRAALQVAHKEHQQQQLLPMLDIGGDVLELTSDGAARASLVRYVLSTLLYTRVGDSAHWQLTPHVHGFVGWTISRRSDGKRVDVFEQRPAVVSSAAATPRSQTLATIGPTLNSLQVAALIFQVLTTLETAFWARGFVHGSLSASAIDIDQAHPGTATRPWRYTRGTTGGGLLTSMGSTKFLVPPAAHGGRIARLGGNLERARAWLTIPAASGQSAVLLAPTATRNKHAQVDMTRDVRSLAISLLLSVLDAQHLVRQLTDGTEWERAHAVHLFTLLGMMAALDQTMPHWMTDRELPASTTDMIATHYHAYFPHGMGHHYARGAYFKAALALNHSVRHEMSAEERTRFITRAARPLVFHVGHERAYVHTASEALNDVVFVPWVEAVGSIDSDDDGDATNADAVVDMATVPPDALLVDPWTMHTVLPRALAPPVQESDAKGGGANAPPLPLPVSPGVDHVFSRRQ